MGFLGCLDREDWRDCYAAADLFVFASVTETQGLVVTDAARGGGRRDGDPGRDGGGPGGIVTRLDQEELAAAVDRLLSDPELYAAKRREAVEEAQRWSAGAMAERMLALYADALRLL